MNGEIKMIEVDPFSDTVVKIQKNFDIDDETPIVLRSLEIQNDRRNFQELGARENENIYVLGKFKGGKWFKRKTK